ILRCERQADRLDHAGVAVATPPARGGGQRLTVPVSAATGRSSRGRAATQAAIITASDAAKMTKPTHDTSSFSAYMLLRFRSTPVVATRVTCTIVKSTKYSITGKCTARANSTR